MSPTEVYESRQRIKKLIAAYRLEAERLGHTGVGNVHPMEKGAFVEVQIWIPLERVEPSGSGTAVGGPEGHVVGDASQESAGSDQPGSGPHGPRLSTD